MADDDIESFAELDRVIALAKFVANAKNIELRARSFAKLNRHYRETEEKLVAVQNQIEQMQAALAERQAALDAQAAALDARTAKFEASVYEAHAALRASHDNLSDVDRRLRYRILAHADLLHGFNEQLQMLPDWQQIRNMVPNLPPDLPATPPAQVISENVHEDWTGNVFVPGSTVTRTIRGAA